MSRRTLRQFVVISLVAALSLLLAGIPALASDGNTELEAALNGWNEVNATGLGAGDPDGKGEAQIKVRQNKGQVCFEIEAEDIALPVLAGHIHAGPAGVNGPVVVNFNLGALNPGTGEDVRFKGCVAVTNATLLQSIATHPWDYYVNLHNAQFPGGVIRGQLASEE